MARTSSTSTSCKVRALSPNEKHDACVVGWAGSATGYLNRATVERKLRAVVGQKARCLLAQLPPLNLLPLLAQVQTQYGAGVVVRYRREDDIYIVSLEFALAYLNGEVRSPFAFALRLACSLLFGFL